MLITAKQMLLMRFQLRWAWTQLGCRCIFSDKHEKIVEDNHCPIHGIYVTKDTWPSIEGYNDDGTKKIGAI